MEWYYAVGDKQMGPVNDEDFKRLAAEGTIRPDTLVWCAGMDNWKPYREVTAASSPGIPTPTPTATNAGSTGSGTGSGTVVCRECGKIFRLDDVVKFGDSFVCGNCKPLYVQRMHEGVGNTGFGAEISEDELLGRDYDVEIGEALSQGWESFKQNAGIMIGATVIVYAILFGLGIIPFVGGLIQWVINGAMLGGLWMVFIKCIRDQNTTIGDAFCGFGPRFTSLFATSLVTSLLSGICMLPAVIVFLVMVGVPVAMSGQTGNNLHLSTTAIIAVVAAGIPGAIVAVYLSVAWMFSIALVADKGLGFWNAMTISRKVVTKHWWATFGLMLVVGILSMIGVMACGVGVLVTAPVGLAALAWHYQRVFGDLAPETD